LGRFGRLDHVLRIVLYADSGQPRLEFGRAAVPQRPDRIGDGNLPTGQRTIDRWFDLNAFATPQQFTFGNSANFVLIGPGYFNTDLGVHRNFQVGERAKLSFRWEMFNSFNRANFNNPNATIGTAPAGQISGTLPARIMQFGLKLNF
jgi:hypothetical protein